MMTKNGKITWTNDRRKLSDLIPWDINPATISKDAAKRLEESLDEFGQVETIAISPNNEIYDGHQRQVVWGASSKFGADYVVDVRVSSRELTERERKKLVIFLRKGTVGEIDFDVLANNWELDDLLEWGFDKKELDIDLWAGNAPEDPGAQIDNKDILRDEYKTEIGQMWQLGRHKLIIGDCTDKNNVNSLMGSDKAQLFFTDPPYGMDKGFENDNLKDGDLTDFNNKWIPLFIGYDDAIFISFHSPRLFWTVLDSARNNGWKVGRYFGLYKPNDMTFPWHSWLGVSESILLFIRGKPKFNTDHPSDTSFWHDTYLWNHKGIVMGETKIDRQSLSHPSIKPIPVCEDLIFKTSFDNDIIYDPFLGSGTTLIACERISRICRAIEIDPGYSAVSIKRWEDLTGRKAILC